MSEPALERFERGAISAQVALMELLLEFEDVQAVADVLARDEARHAPAIRTLLNENRARCEQLVASLRAQSSPLPGANSEAALARVRELFDTLVAQSEEASVALYSLGNPTILAAATDELAAYLRQCLLLGDHARVLDFGCGTGRLELALAGHVAHIHGVDLSPAMIDRARQRCASLANVTLSLGSGRDLHEVDDASCTLVLVVDSFPYVVEAGGEVVGALFAELRRVLAPGGQLLLFNYSYRDDLELDRLEVAERARENQLAVRALGTFPLSLWNGCLFWLARS